jgi:tRNA (guanine10-N2)-methyltransferase
LFQIEKGIREKAKKIGSKNNQPEENVTSSNKPVLVGIHLPQHTRYKLGEIFYDLLSFSAQHLSIGSRLVFWMPVYLEIDRSLYK